MSKTKLIQILNIFTISLPIMLTACEQLAHGQTQPVTTNSKGDYYTTCGGAVETWGSCFYKASKVCENGYYETSRFENSTGNVREFSFRCKK